MKTMKLISSVILISLLLLLLVTAGNLVFFWTIFNWAQNGVHDLTGLEGPASNLVVSIVFAIMIIMPLGKMLLALTPIPQKRKSLYRAIIFLGIGAFSLFTHVAGRNKYFDPTTGKPVKFYSHRPSGEYFFTLHGGFDPLTGQPLKPVSQEVIQKSKGWYNSANAFFDAEKGKAIQWYSEDKYGAIAFFQNPGFDPITGDSLKEVTKEVVSKFLNRKPKDITPFDSIDGSNNMYYVELPGGKYRFYDKPGFDSETGEKRLPVTKEVILKSKGISFGVQSMFSAETGKPIKFYSRWPNGEIHIYNKPGFDTLTGEVLKEVNREIALESLGLVSLTEIPKFNDSLKMVEEPQQIFALRKSPGVLIGNNNQPPPSEDSVSSGVNSSFTKTELPKPDVQNSYKYNVTFNNETRLTIRISNSSGQTLDYIYSGQTKKAKMKPGTYYQTFDGKTRPFVIREGENKRLNFRNAFADNRAFRNTGISKYYDQY